MKHTIGQVALAHKRYNQTKYKHHFFSDVILRPNNQPTGVLARFTALQSSLLCHFVFGGLLCSFSHISRFFCSKMHTVCSVFVFKSRLFYRFCCTSTKSCAYVDVTLVKKTRKKYHCSSVIVCLFEQQRSLFIEREKMKIHTTNSNREISFEYRGVAHND